MAEDGIIDADTLIHDESLSKGYMKIHMHPEFSDVMFSDDMPTLGQTPVYEESTTAKVDEKQSKKSLYQLVG